MVSDFDNRLAAAEAAIAALVPDEHGFVEIAGWCLDVLLTEYRRRGHLQVELDDVLVSNGKLNARIERMRADLARALPIVEAAGALVEEFACSDDSAKQAFADLLDALASAVRTGEQG